MSHELLKIDRVTCPVCGNQVCGEDSMINFHLGTLLFPYFSSLTYNLQLNYGFIFTVISSIYIYTYKHTISFQIVFL